jgi:hypothetical protein
MGWLDRLPTYLQALIVVLGFAGVTIAGLFVVRGVVSWESLLENKSVDQMSQLNDSRRLRYVYYSEDLPSLVWIVIYPEYQGFARDDQHDASR